jgi:hypothetical protein
MPLNDDTGDEFAAHLENEHIFDANPPPGIEMLGVHLQSDRGSGSAAEDGPIEITGDDNMDAIGNLASEDGQSEIGNLAAEDGQSEIGLEAPFESFMMGPTRMGDWSPESQMGNLASEDGQSEIGDWSPESQMGDWSPESQMGDWSPESQIGLASEDGQSEIGLASEDGQSEIGAALAKVVEKARDNRQPPPPMKAVDVDAPIDEGFDPDVSEFLIGAAMAAGKNHFPITTEFMNRAGAGLPPRYVRVDTEESYKAFRTEQSPERGDLADKVAELQAKLEEHMADGHGGEEMSPELSDDMEDLVLLGQQAEAADEEKRVELWMPKQFQGNVEAWREGGMICASLRVEGKNGKPNEIRICTSMEPIAKCVDEMSRHASESGVPASTIVGVLPAMGCVLGAGTIMKETAAAAKSIMEKAGAVPGPFMVRIEPKTNPALCALAMLAMACKYGNKQACSEWHALAKLSPAPVRQAMHEALAIAKEAVK